jgi:hypothetical protein
VTVEIALVLGLAALIAVVGIRLGMLVAPRLDRLADPDEEPDARSDDER